MFLNNLGGGLFMLKLNKHKSLAWVLLTVFMASAFMLSGCGSRSTAEQAANWTLVNPEGVAKVTPIKLNQHPTSLEGKTVALRWNGKENGNNFLDGVAAQLQKNVKNVKVIKLYETMPETNSYGTSKMGPDVIAKIAALKPDLIISSQAD
jgi:ABC-type Fe3+-hydroxamate transport system substrate-binding protein